MADPNALNPFALVVYVPPCYDVTTTRYPAIYLIHGAGVDDTHWESLGLFKLMDEGIRAGKLAPAIIVLPNGNAGLYMNTSGGPGSYEAQMGADEQHLALENSGVAHVYRIWPGGHENALWEAHLGD